MSTLTYSLRISPPCALLEAHVARTYSRLDFFRAAMTDALYTYLHNVEPADAETAAIISADYISAYAAVSKLHLDAYKPTLTVTIGVHKFTMTRTQAKD